MIIKRKKGGVMSTIIASISTIGFAYLWFYIVRKEMKFHKSRVASAEINIKSYQRLYTEAIGSPKENDMKNVLEIGIDIYAQTANHYNTFRKKPQNIVPAFLMGFWKVESTKSVIILIDDYQKLKNSKVKSLERKLGGKKHEAF